MREEEDKIAYLQYRSIVVKDKNNVRKINTFQLFKTKFHQNKTKTTPDTNFESMFFNFTTNECFVDNDHDPDVNFYHDVSMLDTQYLMPDKFKTNFKDFPKNSFSVLHLNIRSLNKNLEAFSEFCSKLNHVFSGICFSETWAKTQFFN